MTKKHEKRCKGREHPPGSRRSGFYEGVEAIVEPVLMTIPKAARRAGLGVRQLRRAVQLGEVEAMMVGSWPRVRWESVVRWIESQRVRPSEDVKQRVAEAVERRSKRGSLAEGR